MPFNTEIISGVNNSVDNVKIRIDVSDIVGHTATDTININTIDNTPSSLASVSILDNIGQDNVFSPNDDGIQDNINISFEVNKTGTYNISIDVLPSESIILTGNVNNVGIVNIIWDGKSDGTTISDGKYPLNISFADNRGVMSYADSVLIIDTTPPTAPVGITPINDETINTLTAPLTVENVIDTSNCNYTFTIYEIIDGIADTLLYSSAIEEGDNNTTFSSDQYNTQAPRPLVELNSYYLTVFAEDRGGNIGEWSIPMHFFIGSTEENIIVETINYPNPFDPSVGPTHIKYILTRSAMVSMNLYNTAGELVQEIINGKIVSAGERYELWNGADYTNEILANGIYICEIVAEAGGTEERNYRKIAIFSRK